VGDASSSDGLTISGNKIYGDIGQILNTNDLDALIEVGGSVEDVTIADNTLSWSGSVDAGRSITTNSGTVYTQGIFLYGDINEDASTTGDKIILKDNVFSTEEPSDYASDAILLYDTALSGFGTLSSAVYLVDTTQGNTTYAAWEDDTSILGSGYEMSGGADLTDAIDDVSESYIETSGSTDALTSLLILSDDDTIA
jgi:hypothetical protein